MTLRLHMMKVKKDNSKMKNRQWIIGLFFLGMAGMAHGQSRLLRMDEMFQLADSHSKSINLYALAVDEAHQAIRVAQGEKLPAIQADMEFKYIGDGCMTDRDFSNGVHADMPHYGHSFVVKASQVVYAGGRISRGIEQARLKQPAGCPVHAAGLLPGSLSVGEPAGGLSEKYRADPVAGERYGGGLPAGNRIEE